MPADANQPRLPLDLDVRCDQAALAAVGFVRSGVGDPRETPWQTAFENLPEYERDRLVTEATAGGHVHPVHSAIVTAIKAATARGNWIPAPVEGEPTALRQYWSLGGIDPPLYLAADISLASSSFAFAVRSPAEIARHVNDDLIGAGGPMAGMIQLVWAHR